MNKQRIPLNRSQDSTWSLTTIERPKRVDISLPLFVNRFLTQTSPLVPSQPGMKVPYILDLLLLLVISL